MPKSSASLKMPKSSVDFIEVAGIEDLTVHERDLVADLRRSCARATAKGVSGETVVSMLIDALVKEAHDNDINCGGLVEGVKLAATYRQGGLDG
jgi:hypothetical protein